MKHLFNLIVLLFAISNTLFAQENLEGFITKTDNFLKKYTQEGHVNYVAIARNSADLQDLLNYISKAPVSEFSMNQKTAFYINAYNILVIDLVIQSVKSSSNPSPKSIEGFFDTHKHNIAGERLTLNDIEQKKLIMPTQDPKLHFVLVCAARGCPKIANFAFKPDVLQEQLIQKTRMALDDSDFIRVNEAKKEVAISEIFTWHEEDFLKKYPSIKEFINTYRSEKLNSTYTLTKYTYDWSLNN